MEFLKKLGRSLFGSSRSSAPAKKKSKSKNAAKPAAWKSSKSAKKKPAKKPAKKPVSKPKKKAKGKRTPAMVKKALAALPVAEVTHYFPHVKAAVLKIKTGNIRIGDELRFKGHTTNFKQRVVSMQIDHKPVMVAGKGDDFGVEVGSRVRVGDLVFKK